MAWWGAGQQEACRVTKVTPLWDPRHKAQESSTGNRAHKQRPVASSGGGIG